MEDSNCSQPQQPKRRRRVTEIALGWVADRLRRCEEIKQQVKTGSYQVDSSKVASSIVNEDS